MDKPLHNFERERIRFQTLNLRQVHNDVDGGGGDECSGGDGGDDDVRCCQSNSRLHFPF